MRIAVVGPSRHPLRHPYAGGQEAQVATLLRGLRERGHHVVLHAAPGSDPALADELVELAVLPRLSEVAALDPQLPERDFLTEHHAYTAVVADLLDRAGTIDVIHHQGLHHLPLSMSRALPAPVVATLHTPPFPWLELGAALAAEGTRFVAVSAALAARWTTLPTPPVVIPNGVREDDFPPGPGGEDLVWFGRITPEKGLDVAIDAARLAGRRLRVVGPVSDPDWFGQQVRPRLGADVEHLGPLGHTELAQVLGRCAAALVTPRWEEPFGLVAVESALCGTPVLALDRGGLGEVVRAGLGVVVPREQAERAGAARALADALPEALALGRAAVRAAAVARFGAGAMTDAYEGVLAEAAAR